jgi:hypothetical protein
MPFSIYQYSVADTIGVQTPGNLAYFGNWTGRTVEVLQNWLGKPEFDTKRCKYLIYIDHVRELPLQEA